MLGQALAGIRPELDLYLMTEISLEDVAGWMGHKQYSHRLDTGLTHHRSEQLRSARTGNFEGSIALPNILAVFGQAMALSRRKAGR